MILSSAHIGRLAPEKNLEYLAETAALLVKARAGVGFLVVGEGPSSGDIRRIFKEFQVEDRLIMPGKATGRDLADAYQAMDLFIFSSKSETQGMVLVEAMAAGKPGHGPGRLRGPGSGRRRPKRPPAQPGRLAPGFLPGHGGMPDRHEKRPNSGPGKHLLRPRGSPDGLRPTSSLICI